MTICNYKHELGQYLKQEDEEFLRSEEIEKAKDSVYQEALVEQIMFDTLDQEYEVYDSGQLQRALRELDRANYNFNAMMASHMGMLAPEYIEATMYARIPIDAVFTALSQIQDRLKQAAEHYATHERVGY